MRAAEHIECPHDTQFEGRTTFKWATLTRCSMERTLARGVCFDYATISETVFNHADISFATFDNTKLVNCSLHTTTLLAVSFSDNVILTNTDVTCAILLGARHGNQPVTRAWLKERGALNSELAVTNYQELIESLNSNRLDLRAAEELKERLELTIDNLKSIQRMQQLSHENLKKVSWMVTFATDHNRKVMQDACHLLHPYILNLSMRDKIVINEQTFLSLVEQKICPQQVKLQPYMRHENPVSIKSVNEMVAILHKGKMPEFFELTLQGMTPNFVKALLHVVKFKQFKQLNISIECTSVNITLLELLIEFIETRDSHKKVVVDFVNIDIPSAYMLKKLFKNHYSTLDMYCGKVSFAMGARGDIYDLLQHAIDKHALNQAAIACLILRQGQQKLGQPLGFINNDVLNEIFNRALPNNLSQQNKNTIIDNIYKACPEGKFFDAKKTRSPEKTNSFGFKPGFLNKK